MFEFMGSESEKAIIKVIGIGGVGISIVEQMMRDSVEGVQFIMVGTDPQTLGNAKADSTLLLDSALTKGTDAHPEVEGHISQADRESLQSLLVETDMVFIIAEMGEAKSAHIAPILAEMAQQKDILTVGLVTETCSRDDKRCMSIVRQGRAALIKHVDSLFTLPSATVPMEREYSDFPPYSFKATNEAAMATVRGIVELITRPGLIDVDVNDICVVMAGRGLAKMGTGTASGNSRAEEAAGKATHSLLGEGVELASAGGILINITSDLDMMIEEFETVGNAVKTLASENTIMVVGTVIDPEMQGKMRVTLVASGIAVASELPILNT